MQRRQPDPTLSAVHSVGSLDADPVDVVVLSSDEGLISTLQEAAGTANVIWHAPSEDAAVDLLVGGRCGIFIADLAVVRTDASALLEKLQAQFPELVLLGAGRREDEGAVARLISKGHVYRFLHKPVSPARANLFLATATRRYRELVPGISPAMATVRHFTQPSNRGTLVLGIGVVAALALVGVGMLMMRPSTHDIAPTAVEPVASANAPATATTSAADEIEAAKHAISEGRLAPPAQDNALQHYRSALGLEPDNAEAKAGIEDILLTLEEGVTQAIQARDAPAATRALATLRQAQSDYPQLAPLSEQIVQLSRALSAASSKPAAAAKIAPPPVVAAVPNAPNIKLARARIASGQWLTPEGDSALTYLRAARTQNEEGSVITILATDLGSRLLDQSRAAIAGGDAPQARARYNDAISLDREFDLSLPGALEVGKELDELTTTEKNQSANQLKELLAPAIKQRESGQLIEPAGNNAYETIKAITTQYGEVAEVRAEQQRLVFTLLDHARTAFASGDLEQADLLAKRAEELVPGMSATETLRQQVNAAFAKRTAATSVISAGSLRRTREIPATYPPEARVRNIEGWVDLEFTVAADGSTRDIEVKAAQPANTFDKAASDALRRWRFEPVLRDNEAVDQRARIRMQFSLK